MRYTHWTRYRYEYTMTALMVVLVATLSVTGCKIEEREPYKALSSRPSLFTDPVTGCQYIVMQDRGVTPRLNIEGKPMCGTVIEKSSSKVAPTT